MATLSAKRLASTSELIVWFWITTAGPFWAPSRPHEPDVPAGVLVLSVLDELDDDACTGADTCEELTGALVEYSGAVVT